MASADTATPVNNDTKATSKTNIVLVSSYVAIGGLWTLSQVVDIPYVVHLLVLVTSILYAACHASLILLEDQARLREYEESGKSAENGDEPPPRTEVMGKEEAMQFPLVGSASLFSLYLAFKFFDKDTVNLIISVYFCLMGAAALTITFAPFLLHISPSSLKEIQFAKEIQIKHPLPEFIGGESPWKIEIEVNAPEAVAVLGSLIFTGFYFKTKHWALNNVFGIVFCLQGIEKFSLGTYKIGAILLVGLFFYDIFWVFGTEVMVTVAKSLDGPIKILFPRSLTPDPETGKLMTSLLGLGDIVIPGFFLALLLRFDACRAKVPALPKFDIHSSFPKPYFHSALLAYVLGLGLTMFIMIYFQAAQPALLYLVPACLGSSLLCAFFRGELKELFAYSEEEKEEIIDTKKTE